MSVINYDHAEAPSEGRARATVSHEFTVVLSTGQTFYTGGFDDLAKYLFQQRRTWVSESIHDVANAWHQGQFSIAGTFDPTSNTYYETFIDPTSIVAVADLRTNTDRSDHE